MNARVFVTLRKEVLDPQGAAVKRGLGRLGFDTVMDVRVGKYLEIRLNDMGAPDRSAAEQQVQTMCEKMLVNPVIEEYRFEIDETEPPGKG